MRKYARRVSYVSPCMLQVRASTIYALWIWCIKAVDNMKRESVDILTPPTFEKSGIVKLREDAWNNNDWIGTFNLWIVRDIPEASVV